MFRFIDSMRFMKAALDSLVDNLICNLYNIKCKHCKDYRNCEKGKVDSNESCQMFNACKNMIRLL